jgi:hypothetical protein
MDLEVVLDIVGHSYWGVVVDWNMMWERQWLVRGEAVADKR